MEKIYDYINSYSFSNWIFLIIGIFLSYFGYIILKRVLNLLINKIILKSRNQWDNIIFNKRLIDTLSLLIPIMIIYLLLPLFPGDKVIYQRLLLSLSLLIILLSVGSLLTSINQIYNKKIISKKHPIKSYIQIVKLIIYTFGGLVSISIIMGKSPTVLISSLGAMTAVLLLIFRDTILSFVASLQITSNNLLKVGDWIEVPSFKADGDVIDIALHTVKIQNWDKTYTVIPTHKLIESSFKNWRGMSQSGGRRVKRSIYIDMSSIKFYNSNDIEQMKKISVLKKYIESKIEELNIFNETKEMNLKTIVNGRRMTNIGTFRAYIELYLKSKLEVHDKMTLLVRQLKPTNNGLPIEIYCFINDIEWKSYEGIQADIFDHILAVIPEFGLKVFQNPTGSDFKNLKYISNEIK